MKFPGNITHQKILKVLLDKFKNDPNILCLIIFGSLARGNWDDDSDLDLDVIVSDDNHDKVKREIEEMRQNLTAAGLAILLYFEEAPNEQKIVFDTLDRIEIRFHTLTDTNKNITDSMQILYGKISKEEIIKSAVNKKDEPSLGFLNNKFLELSIYVPIALKRGRLINAQFFLNKIRQTLIQIYVLSHNLEREFDFGVGADAELVKAIVKTYCTADSAEIKSSFNKLISIYVNNIKKISANKITLTDKQLKILKKVNN